MKLKLSSQKNCTLHLVKGVEPVNVIKDVLIRMIQIQRLIKSLMRI